MALLPSPGLFTGNNYSQTIGRHGRAISDWHNHYFSHLLLCQKKEDAKYSEYRYQISRSLSKKTDLSRTRFRVFLLAVSPMLPTTYYEHLLPTNWTRALFPPFVSQIFHRRASHHSIPPPLLRRNETVGKCCQVTGSRRRRRRRRRFMGAIIQTHLWLGWKEEGPAGSTWIAGGGDELRRQLWWSGDSGERLYYRSPLFVRRCMLGP